MRFTRPVPVPGHDEGTEVVVTGVVKEVTDDGLTRLDLTATCRARRCLSLAQATIRNADDPVRGGTRVGKSACVPVHWSAVGQ